MDSTCRKVGDFKLDLNGSFGALATDSTHTASKATRHATTVLIVSSDARKAKFSAHEEFLVTAKLLNLPDNGALLGGVVYRADVGSESGGIGIVGDRDDDFDVVGRASSLELGPGLEHVFDTRAGVGFDEALDPD